MTFIARFGKLHVARVVDLERSPFGVREFLPATAGKDLTALCRGLPADRFDASSDSLLLDFAGYLIWGDGPTILVDTAIGCGKRRPAAYGWNERTDQQFLTTIAELGFRPGDIDIVVCTHLHSDHVGWNTSQTNGRWEPTFRNARHMLSRVDLDDTRVQHAADPEFNNGCYADSIEPLLDAGLVDPVDGVVDVADGVTLSPLPGHTPGNLVLWVGEVGAGAVIAGDAIHHELQLARPAWSTRYCGAPDQSATAREGLLAEVATTGAALLPAHFPPCRVRAAGQGFQWLPL